MYKVYVGKNSGYGRKKYNTNDVINKCLSALKRTQSAKGKIVKFNIGLGFYMGEFEDTTVAKFENFKEAVVYGIALKRKLNQKEVLIISDYEQKGFVKKSCYTVEWENNFLGLQKLIDTVSGGTLYIYENKIVLEMFDFYGDISDDIMKLKNKGIKVKHNYIYILSSKNVKERKK